MVYALLLPKTEQCYHSMWSLLLRRSIEKNLNLRPEVVYLDFERAMHNAVSAFFPDTRIDFCRFHLGQCWWMNIQALGLSRRYRINRQKKESGYQSSLTFPSLSHKKLKKAL
jgi:transposase-like protein